MVLFSLWNRAAGNISTALSQNIRYRTCRDNYFIYLRKRVTCFMPNFKCFEFLLGVEGNRISSKHLTNCPCFTTACISKIKFVATVDLCEICKLGRAHICENRNANETVVVFSCDQAALRILLSVRPSVCLSVRHTLFTMFQLSYYHEIFRSDYQWQKWRPCKRSRAEVKSQGQRGQHPT